MLMNEQQVQTLMEALPYLSNFKDKTNIHLSSYISKIAIKQPIPKPRAYIIL